MSDWRDVPSAEPWGRLGLTRRARAVARAAAEAALATGAEGNLCAPDPEWVARVVDDYDRSLGEVSFPIRTGVNALLIGFDLLPAAIGRGLKPLRRRALGDRLQFLDRVENHPVGAVTMAWIAIKVPLLLSAFEEGEPLRETGFDRPSTAARRLTLHPNSEGTHP